jgi:hypothetical protein
MQNSYADNSEKASKDAIELLKLEKLFKGENSNQLNGLCLKGFEHNLYKIKHKDTNTILNKFISLYSLSANLKKNHHLYVVNSEGLNSKFNEDLLEYKNSNIHIINADTQKDNSIYGDRSLNL